MTDIVERLHGKVPMAWGDEGFMLVDEDAVLATFTEAADEIERLRDENEKLRAIIDQLRGVFFNGVYIAESKVAKLNLARAALVEKE